MHALFHTLLEQLQQLFYSTSNIQLVMLYVKNSHLVNMVIYGLPVEKKTAYAG